MRKERLLAFLFFLTLIADVPTLAYYNDLWTPGRLVEWLVVRLPVKLSPFEIILIIMLATTRRRGPIAKPMVTAIYVSLASLFWAAAYGLARGGLVLPMYTQMICWIVSMITAMTVLTVCSTAADLYRINTAILYGAIWRACIANSFYIMSHDWDWTRRPACMTSHEDSALFVIGLAVLISRAIEFGSKQYIRQLVIWGPVIVMAIQVNNRRLAWASLVMALISIYFLLPTRGRALRTVNRALKVVIPIVAIYVTVGWGRSEKIFAPLQSFSSMGAGTVDKSTLARDNENVSMITMIQDAPLLGTGFGHEWIELDSSYTVPLTAFPFYHYSPHDSIMALLTFMGGFGFAGLWAVVPVSIFLNARTCRNSLRPDERSIAATGVVQCIAFVNQAFGDMGGVGVPHIMVATLFSVGIASAARVSASSGARPYSSSRAT